MDQLPNELLVNIFKNLNIRDLSPASSVCRRWNDVIANTPQLNSHFTMVNSSDMNYLRQCRRTVHVTTFVLQIKVHQLRAFFQELSTLCPNIRSLTIKGNMICNRKLSTIRKCFPKLKHLDVCFKHENLEPTLSKTCTNLKSIVLNNNLGDENNTILRSVGENCDNLQELHMYGLIYTFDLTQFQNILTIRREYLSKLTLRCYNIDDQMLGLLADCSNLKSLSLYHSWLMTDVGLQRLTKLKRLQTLHITGLHEVSSNGLTTFLNDLCVDRIDDLNLSSSMFNDEHVVQLLARKVNLRKLEVWNTWLTHYGAESVLCNFCRLRSLITSLDFHDRFLPLCQETDIMYVRFNNAYIECVKSPNGDKEWSYKIYNRRYRYHDGEFRESRDGLRASLLRYSDDFIKKL